ncbi:AraC family transcriptional regulator [Paenibacillus tarimensis]|uniref:AraC family transcriptional regulator n=1 Tax=Paenibacillus tarimensis TaxID=416012 RepID=UPI001F467DC6|nr:AraC family transcriptional regulator [Paenibacillus tarimensis]MCF2945412.1 AraC family transcriptional regulator [Paenibacillus tarimensis]
MKDLMEYEFLTFDNDLPIKIILHPVDDTTRFIPRHWHESVEISYVLTGSIETIYIEGTSYTSREGDIVVINSNDVHSFTVDPEEDGSALTVIISYEFLKNNFPDMDRIRFQCISSIETDAQQLSRMAKLRETLDTIIAVYRDRDRDPLAPIRMRGLSYELIYMLLGDFAVEKSHAGAIKSQKHLSLLTEITDFIKVNYKQQLPIALLASQFGFTAEYLCRFFRKQIGMTILQYIHAIRLENGHRDLVMTDHPVTQIAYDNGFPNVKSFNRVFKAMYAMTPDQYRKSKVPNLTRGL